MQAKYLIPPDIYDTYIYDRNDSGYWSIWGLYVFWNLKGESKRGITDGFIQTNLSVLTKNQFAECSWIETIQKGFFALVSILL